MVYQTIKFFLVRMGVSIFLMMTLGFGALYFFHEIALSNATLDDTVIQGLLSMVCLFLGFFAYGLFGDRLFEKDLKGLKGIRFEQFKEKEIIRQFDNLLEFTFSSYFLPRRGRSMRKDVVCEYAEYLHSLGRDDPSALRIYLKAFLQNPKDSRFRIPLVSALKRVEKLQSAEIDLLLVMLKTEADMDKIIAFHLAPIFMGEGQFNRKTEPVFLASIDPANENTQKILDFVLPLLLAKNRSDDYALNFYLRTLAYQPNQEERLREIIGKSFCHGHWEAVDPELHEKCKKIFVDLNEEQRKNILLEINENRISEKWKKLKLFSREDIKVLHGLKMRFGIIKSVLSPFKDVFFLFVQGIKITVKSITLKALDGLIWYQNSSFLLKLAGLFLIVLVALAGIGALKVQQEKATSLRATVDAPKPGMAVHSKESEVRKVHTIQIAAVTFARKANQIVKKLRDRGIENLYVIKTKRRGGGFWYKIRLEKFSNEEDAQRFADHLIDRGIIKNYFIVTYVPQLP
ncbi:MAG: SPOR domain-containing protein [Nitrospinota bacterium]|nr:SPOR domain-containing protein [Nitrospinota bacterium]